VKDRKIEQNYLEKLVRLFGIPDSLLSWRNTLMNEHADAQKAVDESKAAQGTPTPAKSRGTEI
jgi:hypothetical protein